MKRKKAKKVLWALRKVQRVCKRREICTGCVFGMGDRLGTACRLMGDPANWDLKGVAEQMEEREKAKGNTDGER